MKDFFRALWRGWIVFGTFLGRVNNFILMTLIYFLILPFFAVFFKLKDTLRIQPWTTESYWIPVDQPPLDLENYRHLY